MASYPSAGSAEDVLAFVEDGADLIVPWANGEPVSVLDAIEAHAGRWTGVRVHQMHALHDRPYLHGTMREHLLHMSYFLSPVTRPAFHEGGCELVPNHFSEVPRLLRENTRCSMILAAASPMDRHGYFSLGTNCDYVSPFIGRVPFFLEVNTQMPRTFGRNQVHVSQIVGRVEVDRPLLEFERAQSSKIDERIAGYVAERIPDGATIQAGIGSIPNALLAGLGEHRHLGVHTELLSDAMIHLVETGVVTGTRKSLFPGKVVTTFAYGTKQLYDFLHENPVVEFLPVDYVNDPRVIADEDCFVSINATTEVDLIGQCASETVGGRYWSSSGGQSDFARGAMYSPHGRAFVVLPSTAANGQVSRIRGTLTPGSIVTTLKNTVDHVVTEYGVADMRGRSVAQRAAALITIAHPRFREELAREARDLDYA
ncbi:MAG: acetyl-CoA hydrolase/transferase family protein [Acidimicrobiia bacterium]